jgi:hypothetical protein
MSIAGDNLHVLVLESRVSQKQRTLSLKEFRDRLYLFIQRVR